MTIQAAVDAAARRDVIDVAAGTYVENVVIPPGALLTIQGAGPAATIIDGNGSGVTFELVARNTRVTMSGVGIQNGSFGIALAEGARVTLSDCAITDNVASAGILVRNHATANVNGCTIAGNASRGISVGNGVPGSGRLTIAASTVSGNGSTGIWSEGQITMTDATVSGNGTSGSGGGVRVESAVIKRSTISGNTGSGLSGSSTQFGRGTVRVSDTTISGNTALSGGGGVFVVPGMRFERVTITGNSADTGGALKGSPFIDAKPIFRASIIANNATTSFSDCGATIRAYSGNLIDDPTCAVDVRDGSPLIVADPLLGPLQDNGGPTETHALGAGSSFRSRALG